MFVDFSAKICFYLYIISDVCEGSESSGTTGSPDTSPASGGTPEYFSNPSSSEPLDNNVQNTSIHSLPPGKKEFELKDYFTNNYLGYSDPTAAGDSGQGHTTRSTNQALECGEVGGALPSWSNQKEASDEMSKQQRTAHNGSNYGSQPFPHGQKYHSAPPTPLDTINSSYEDFDSTMAQPGRENNYEAKSTMPAIHRHNSSRHFDPNQNTKRTPSLSFWGQRSSPISKENSAMNKLTDLFKGTFKF